MIYALQGCLGIFYDYTYFHGLLIIAYFHHVLVESFFQAFQPKSLSCRHGLRGLAVFAHEVPRGLSAWCILIPLYARARTTSRITPSGSLSFTRSLQDTPMSVG